MIGCQPSETMSIEFPLWSLQIVQTLLQILSLQLILQQQKRMASLKNFQHRKRLSDLRKNLKEVLLMKKLAKKQQIQNQPTFSKPSIVDPECCYEKQTNSTPSEINTSTLILKNKMFYSSFEDKYDFFEKLGEGANGCVYRCQHKRNKKIFAVKKFKVSEELLLQVKRNFIQIGQLNHPNICSYKALYFDSHQRFAFLVTNYFAHPTLQAYAIKSEEELKIIVKQLVSAIKYLHQHHICHRDIKPENILYDQCQRKIKIIDFGISKKTFLRGVRRDMLTIIGTNYYFAPQIYLGGGYDQRVDLWALGVTIYKLITGYTPFQSQYHSNTIEKILKSQIQFDEKIWNNYSLFAKDFVTRILRPKNQRLTAAQCQIHFWIQSQERKTKQLYRLTSFEHLISEDFHTQMKNFECSKPKQEGSRYNTHKSHFLLKKIKTLSIYEYDLQDSDDDQSSELKAKGIKNCRITI